jgi:single-strand DNA-binding protein
MAGVNKVILLGNLGADPEVKYLEGGSVMARFNIATSESYTRNGERITQTEWHRIELWENLAKTAEQYLKKGDTVYIEGKIRTDEWQDKEGTNRSITRIKGTSMTLIGGSRRADNNDNTTTAKPAPEPKIKIDSMGPSSPLPSALTDNDPDDLPF